MVEAFMRRRSGETQAKSNVDIVPSNPMEGFKTTSFRVLFFKQSSNNNQIREIWTKAKRSTSQEATFNGSKLLAPLGANRQCGETGAMQLTVRT